MSFAVRDYEEGELAVRDDKEGELAVRDDEEGKLAGSDVAVAYSPSSRPRST